jgi:hypothetical protein
MTRYFIFGQKKKERTTLGVLEDYIPVDMNQIHCCFLFNWIWPAHCVWTHKNTQILNSLHKSLRTGRLRSDGERIVGL